MAASSLKPLLLQTLLQTEAYVSLVCRSFVCLFSTFFIFVQKLRSDQIILLTYNATFKTVHDIAEVIQKLVCIFHNKNISAVSPA